MKSNILYYRK